MAGEQLKLNNLVEAKQNIDKASAYSNEVIEKVSDMAWLLKPNNESISLLITKLKTYSKAAAGTKNIQLSFEVAPEFSMKELSLLQRKAIYLISKEAINNAVKYADCKNIYYNLHSNKDVLSLTIRDDGIGFSEEAINPGNGLQNMRARAAEINAEIDIHSETGTGTTIQLKLNTLN
jgi:signal transduction histidine kinase